MGNPDFLRVTVHSVHERTHLSQEVTQSAYSLTVGPDGILSILSKTGDRSFGPKTWSSFEVTYLYVDADYRST